MSCDTKSAVAFTKGGDTPNFQKLTALLKTDAFKAALEAQSLGRKLTTMRYEVAAIGVGYACYLSRKEPHRARFYQHPFWKARLKKPSPSKLLLHCMMFVYGAHRGSEAKRASDHARALQSAYEQKMPVEDIPAYIKSKGGFDGLLNDTFDGIAEEETGAGSPKKTTPAETLGATPPSASSDDEEDSVEEADDDDKRPSSSLPKERRRDRMKSASNDEEADDDDDRVPPPLQKRFRGSAAKSGGNGGLALTPIPRTKLLEFLIIEAEQPLFDELLNLDVGSERTRLTVERLPDSLDYSVHGDLVPFKRLRLSDL